jgi:hypothetical protein
MAKLPAGLVGMEACGSAHYWAREIGKLGHRVRMLSPQFTPAYVKGNKNDAKTTPQPCCLCLIGTKRIEGWLSASQVCPQFGRRGFSPSRTLDQMGINRTEPADQYPAPHKEHGYTIRNTNRIQDHRH